MFMLQAVDAEVRFGRISAGIGCLLTSGTGGGQAGLFEAPFPRYAFWSSQLDYPPRLGGGMNATG